jgi:hypothetical protein
MTASNPDDDVLAAALIQIASHAQRITDLDTREASHHAGTERTAGRLSDRAEATSARLAAWAEQVYRPGYGRLAAALPPCWARHPLCLYTLDWLSELWSALYLNPQRTATTLAAQAEWQTRLLPAAADQMAREAAGCQHASSQTPRRPPPTWPGHPAPRN